MISRYARRLRNGLGPGNLELAPYSVRVRTGARAGREGEKRTMGPFDINEFEFIGNVPG
jgi:hypothetical protein